MKTKINLKYQCSICWSKKELEYDDYMTAKNNAVYCDDCITKRMYCITPKSDELIATLD